MSNPALESETINWLKLGLAKDEQQATKKIFALEQKLRQSQLPKTINTQETKNMAQQIVARINSFDDLEKQLLQSPTVRPPKNFATTASTKIETAANFFTKAQLQQLPKVQAPALFAKNTAQNIQELSLGEKDLVEQNPQGRTPIIFLLSTLVALAVVCAVLIWPHAHAAAITAFEVLSTVPSAALITTVAALLLSVLATRTKTNFGNMQFGLGGFAAMAAIMLLQLWPLFGSERIEANHTKTQVLRLFGDINVAGEVQGNAIALLGSVNLEQGGKVNGQVLSFIGDVNLAKQSFAGTSVALLGQLNNAEKPQLRDMPSGANGALAAVRLLRQPLYGLSWLWIYFVALGVSAIALLFSKTPQFATNIYGQQSNKALGLGMLICLLSPVVALGLAALPVVGAMGLLFGMMVLLLLSAGAALSLAMLSQEIAMRFGTAQNQNFLALTGLATSTLVFLMWWLWPPLGWVLLFALAAFGAGAIVLLWRDNNLLLQLGKQLNLD